MWQRIIFTAFLALLCDTTYGADIAVVRFAYQPATVPLPDFDFVGAVNRQIEGIGRVEAVTNIADPLLALRAEAADLAVVPSGRLAALKTSGLSLLDVPFLFNDLNDVARFQTSAIGDAALNSLANEGFVGLGYWNFGTQRLLGPPITDADAFKGVKIRATSSTQLQASLRAMGAVPQSLPFGEVYSALQTGVFEAAEASPKFINTAHLYDVAKAVSAQPLVPQTYLVIARQSSWNKYPLQVQTALAREVDATAARLNTVVPEMESRDLEAIRSRGVQVVSLSTENLQSIRMASLSGPGSENIENDSLARLGASAIDQQHRHPLPADQNFNQAPQPTGEAPVFFATDRQMQPTSDFNQTFGSQRGKLTYGTMHVDLGQNRPVAASPSVTRIADLKAFGSDQEFAAALAQSIQASETKTLLIYVHGYNNTFVDAAESAASLLADLKFKGVVLVFSWPSDGTALQYARDETEQETSRVTFQRVLQTIRATGTIPQIDVLAHSMGNRVVTGALQLVAADRSETNPFLHELILAAPDVYTAQFELLLDSMRRLSKRVTLYASATDQALICSQILHQGPRAGLAGPSRVVHNGLDTIDVSNVETQYFSEKIASVIGFDWAYWLLYNSCRKGHSYVTREFAVVNDLHSLVTFGTPPENRILLQKQPVKDFWYWEMLRTAN